jgi:hypothetical protein
MGYDLHIERTRNLPDSDPTPISIEEWRAAITATEGVRLFAGDFHGVRNPKTGQYVGVRASDGDVEVFFPDEEQWYCVFHWFEGSANFRGRCKLGDTSDPVWASAVALASRLGALIRGDEGEIYDLRTGAIIGSVGSA